ncbi:MAG: PocR ligand-binding domain-containing protein [Deltaproteobacteria bacterium]|nr:PocR ligand-binding domain-containing protein [Deltaproteobacteria bacterium]
MSAEIGASSWSGAEQLEFEDLFDVAEIQQIQDAFAEATGVASIITRVDGSPITRPSRFCRLCLDIIRKTPEGLANCQRSDACLGRRNPEGPLVQPCLSGGLWDGGTSISVGDRHVANWLIGQVRDETQDEERIIEYVRTVGGDPDEAKRALGEVTRMSRAQFERVSSLLFLMAQQLSRLAIQNVRQAREIGARKRAEAEQERLLAQLLQSQKMEAIGRLAGGVAHDFNNILTGMSGYTDLALIAALPGDPVREELQEIRHGIDRAAELTRQLLAFSRRQTAQPAVLSLNDVVTRSHKLLARIIGEDVELRCVTSADLWPARVDPGQVEQVLINLAVNARDAMQGGGLLDISTRNVEIDDATALRRAEARPGKFVELAVSDTGHGMDEQTLSHLFEPFFTTKPVGQGTGLGLATAYGIAQQNGGFITVESVLGRGSTFRFHLPRVEGDAQPLARRSMAGVVAGSGERVLLVEDDAVVRRLCERALTQCGYRVLVASGPAEALELSDRHPEPIDLLLTDVVMPGMNGREVCIRVLARHPKAKVLFMSGYTENHIGQHGVLDPGVPFIEKPFTIEALAARTREALARTEPLPDFSCKS